jgi:hypothetical protein
MSHGRKDEYGKKLRRKGSNGKTQQMDRFGWKMTRMG